jgi:hypothetical protein
MSTIKWKVNQTLIKRLKGEYCPRQIKECMIDASHVIPPSESMLKGIYFEERALDLNPVTTLKPLRNGSPSTDEVRIKDQILTWKNKVMVDQSLEMQTAQEYIEYEYSPGIMVHGKLDFTATMIDDTVSKAPIPIIGDLKLTKNIYAQYGDFCWAYPHNMDHTQAYMYTQLYKQAYNETRLFYYFVFDYKPEPEFKIIRKRVEAIDIAELNESIRSGVAKLDYHDSNGWAEVASHDNCKRCPLSANCKSYKPNKPIEVI